MDYTVAWGLRHLRFTPLIKSQIPNTSSNNAPGAINTINCFEMTGNRICEVKPIKIVV